jgi:hypothetical protein
LKACIKQPELYQISVMSSPRLVTAISCSVAKRGIKSLRLGRPRKGKQIKLFMSCVRQKRGAHGFWGICLATENNFLP